MNAFSTRLGLALVISLVAIACASPAVPADQLASGDQETDPTSPEGAKTPASPPAKTPKSGSVTPDPNADPAPAPDPNAPAPDPNVPGGNCAATADFDACFMCCDGPTGGALMNADQIYGTCMDGGGTDAACGQQADAACAASAACQAGIQCLDTSCADKP